jgi:hypothetical protein
MKLGAATGVTMLLSSAAPAAVNPESAEPLLKPLRWRGSVWRTRKTMPKAGVVPPLSFESERR